MSTSSRRGLGSFAAAMVAALLAAGSLASPALAASSPPPPTYRADVSPAVLPAGASTTSTIQLMQLVAGGLLGLRELGSVSISPPAGFVITAASATKGLTTLPVTVASGSATVNWLDLERAGQTAAVTLTAAAPCGVSGGGAWTVVGHSTNVFTSPLAFTEVQDPAGALAVQVSPCRLAFAGQPSTAGTGKTITTRQADPAGAPVAVQLFDGSGNPAAQAGVSVGLAITAGTGTSGALLGGTTSAATDSTGLATFAPTIDRAGRAYRLAATAAGIVAATSGPFDVSDVATVCTGACSASDQLLTTNATVNATSNGGVLTVSLGLDSLDCNDATNRYYVATSQVVSFDVTPATGRTVVTLELAAASVNRPYYRYQVCFSSPTSTFVNRYGATIAAGQPGLLPDCRDCDDGRSLPSASSGPCVVARWVDASGNVYVKFSVPVGDPRGKI
jgi:hypothetical protein